MNPQLRKKLLLFLIHTALLFATVHKLQAQPSLHDSLRTALVQVQDSSKDEKLKQAIHGALALYTKDLSDDSLAEKLLVVDSFVVNAAQLNRSSVLSLTEMIARVLQPIPPLNESRYYTISLDYQAYLNYATGRYEKALPLYKQSLAIRQKTLGEDHEDYASSLSNLALLYSALGQHDKCLPLYQKALSIYRKTLGEQHPYYATALNNLALLYRNTGQYDKALPLYQQALSIYKEINGEDHLSYAISLTNQAYLYLTTGQYNKALPLYQQALQVFKKTLGDEHPYNVSCLNGLASLYQSMGQYDKALNLYGQAISLYKKTLGEHHPSYATAISNLAGLYREMGQYDTALSLLQQAIPIYKKALGEEHPNYAESLNRLGTLYYRMKQYDKALPMYQQSLAIRKKTLGEEHADYGGSLSNLARLYQNMQQYDKALPLYRQALRVYKKAVGVDHPFNVVTLNGLAGLYNVLGNYQEATPILTQAAGIELRFLSDSYANLSEHEKMVLLNKEALQFCYLPSLLFTREIKEPYVLQQLYANELILKGMVLEDQQVVLNSIRKSKDSATLQFYEQWRSNTAFLGKQQLLPIKRRMVYIDSIQDATNELEQQLSRRSQAFRIQIQKHRLKPGDVGLRLKKGEVAIEFTRFPFYSTKQTDSVLYAALILQSQDSTPHFVALCEEKRLKSLLRSLALEQLYVSRQGPLVENHSAALRARDSLYRLIWKPLESYLDGISTVYYAPAGLLNRLALQALPSDQRHLLIDKYRLRLLLSTRSVVMPSIVTSKPKTAGLWGNIRYERATDLKESSTAGSRGEADSSALSAFAFYSADTRAARHEGWRPLPATKMEIDSLNKLFIRAGVRTITFSGSAATEEAFKALDGHSPRVLHLATHGFFLPVKETRQNDYELKEGGNTFTVQQNPLLRSGFVLADGNTTWKGEAVLTGKEDGILTAYEIAQLDLSNTDLVVLSACETGLGDIQGTEGVIGLQRALKLAGVKQLMLSLWKIPDKETRELMTFFYRNWLSGQSTWEALRNAQLTLRKKYPDPFFWAGFVLVE